MDIWTEKTIKTDKLYRAQLGPLSLCLKKVGDEMQIAVERRADESVVTSYGFMEKTDPEPESLDWGRWIVGNEGNSVRLAPMMPN